MSAGSPCDAWIEDSGVLARESAISFGTNVLTASRLFLFVLVVLTAGVLTHSSIARSQRCHAFEALGLAWGLGIGSTGLLTFLLAWIGVPLTSRSIFLSLAGLLVSLLIVNVALGPGLKAVWRRVLAGSVKPQLDRIERVLLVIILLCLIAVFLDALSQPLLTFDSRSNFGIKAKILFHQQGIYNQDFFDPERVVGHQRYPLLVPLAENLVYHFIGGVQDRWAKIVFPLWFSGLISLSYAGLRRTLSRKLSLLGAALLASLPVFTYNVNGGAASGLADVPLTCFFTAFCMFLFYGIQEESSQDLWLAALFGVFTVLTKNEGIALCLIALGVGAVKFDWRKFSRLLLPCASGALLLLPWFEFCLSLPAADENYWTELSFRRIAAGIPHLAYIVPSMVTHLFFKPFFWSVLTWAVLLLVALAPQKAMRMSHGPFLIVPILYCVLLVLIYMITPWNVAEVVPLSLTRLLTHVAPLVVLWMMLQLKAAGLVPETLCLEGKA